MQVSSLSLAFFASTLAVGGFSHADEASVPVHPTPVELEVTPEYRAGQYYAEAHVGTLTAGDVYSFAIAVKSVAQHTLKFQGVKSSCSCLDVSISSHEVEPNETIKLSFKVEVSKNMNDPEAFWYLRLQPFGTPDWEGVSVKITYSVAGLLHFRDDHAVYEISKSTRNPRVRIPVLLTEPVVAENVVVTLPDSFGDAKASVVMDNKMHYVQWDVETKTDRTDYASGEIVCFDPITERQDSVFCVIRRSRGVSVHPGILVASLPDLDSRVVDRGENGEVFMSAVIRFDTGDGQASIEDNSTTRESRVSVKAVLENESIKIKLDRLSNTIFRAKLTLSEDQVKKLQSMQHPVVKWLITQDENSYELQSLVHVY